MSFCDVIEIIYHFSIGKSKSQVMEIYVDDLNVICRLSILGLLQQDFRKFVNKNYNLTPLPSRRLLNHKLKQLHNLNIN